MATNVIQKLTNLSSIHSMRKVNLALDQMPPTFTYMPLKCVPLPFFDIRNSVVVALVLIMQLSSLDSRHIAFQVSALSKI